GACCKGDHFGPVSADHWVVHYQKCIRPHVADQRKCVRKILVTSHLGGSDAKIEPAAGFHCVRDVVACTGVGRVYEHGEFGGTWNEFTHQLDVLAAKGKIGGSGDIAARPSQTFDQSGADR